MNSALRNTSEMWKARDPSDVLKNDENNSKKLGKVFGACSFTQRSDGICDVGAGRGGRGVRLMGETWAREKLLFLIKTLCFEFAKVGRIIKRIKFH